MKLSLRTTCVYTPYLFGESSGEKNYRRKKNSDPGKTTYTEKLLPLRLAIQRQRKVFIRKKEIKMYKPSRTKYCRTKAPFEF